LILRKIIKIVATRCHILKLKCTIFNFGCGSVPNPSAGAYSAPPDSLAGFKGPTSKVREGGRTGEKGKGGDRKGEGKGNEGKGEKEDFAVFPQFQFCHYTAACCFSLESLYYVTDELLTRHQK